MALSYSAPGYCQPTSPFTSNDAHTTEYAPPPRKPRLELEAWEPEHLRKPNSGDIVEGAAPTGLPTEPVHRDAQVKAAAGMAALVCPNNAQCETHAGSFVALTALHRPEPWFAWGGLVEWQHVGQDFDAAAGTLSLTHHIFALRGVAELHPLAHAHVDPYVGLGFGMGTIRSHIGGNESGNRDRSGSGSRTNEPVNAAASTLTTWSPFFAVRVGLDVELGSRLSLGATLDWSNFQALTGDNCPWKAWGMCTSSSWGVFDSDHTIWKVGAALSFAFGREL